MADIRPFPACRPAKGLEAEIAALPYDVYSREEARRYVAAHPGTFLTIDRPETTLPEDVDMYGEDVYRHAGALLNQWIGSGRFVQDETSCYYVYAQSMGGRTQTGIVACASIDDYNRNVIKKHENTRADKEQDRIRHVDACNAQTGPIFLCHRENPVISGIVGKKIKEEPVCDFVSEGAVRNRVWVIDDPAACDVIQAAFAGIDSIYIADGHHRCASAVHVGELRREQHPDYTGEEDFNFFLSVLFPESELEIMDYNRVVHDLNGLTPDQFLEKVLEICEELPSSAGPGSRGIPGDFPERMPGDSIVPVPSRRGEFALCLDGRWHLLRFRGEFVSDDPVDGLDVSILQDRILAPILGIRDPKTDNRIEFVGGIRGMRELEARADAFRGAAFRMHPTSIGELFAVADAGRLMPPKSTWFEPKLLSGLFIHLI